MYCQKRMNSIWRVWGNVKPQELTTTIWDMYVILQLLNKIVTQILINK